MITIKEAIQAATEYAGEIYEGSRLPHLRVEEVDRSEDGVYWLITLGWLESGRTPSGIVDMLGPRALPRTYKTFYVHIPTGEVHKMKIREVD